MFSKTLKGRLIAATTITFLLFLIAIGVSLKGMQSMSNNFMTFLKQDQALFEAYQSMYTQGLQSGQALRNIIFDPHNKKAYDNLNDSAKQFQSAYDAALKLTAGKPEANGQVREIGEIWQKNLEIKARVVNLAQNNFPEAVRVLNKEETPTWRDARKTLLTLIEAEQKHTENIKASVLAKSQFNLTLGIALALAAILFGVIIKTLMVRGMTNRLGEALRAIDELNQGDGDLTRRLPDQGDDEVSHLARSTNEFIRKVHNIVVQVKEAAKQSNAATLQLNNMASKINEDAKVQSEGIFQISTAMEEMSNTVKEVAQNASGAANSANEALDVVKQGNTTGQHTIAALNRIDSTVGTSASTISQLDIAIQRIGEVTNVIKDIAEQTNLLALNAAIEAARAGEQGRGFAVVADEVRKLSERTAASTTDIVNIVQSVQASTAQAVAAMSQARTEVTQGVNYGKEAGRVLQEIDRAVRTVTEMMHHIATAAEEQSAVGTEIARNLERVASITDATTQDIQQTGHAVNDLAKTANNMQDIVNQFKLARH